MMELYIDALKAIADANRLRLVWLLASIDERISVAEAMDVLGDSHYNVSRNLKILHKAGLVTAQKEGKWVFYTLRNENTPFFSELLATVRAIPSSAFADEIQRCKLRLAMRDNGKCVVGPDSDAWKSVREEAAL